MVNEEIQGAISRLYKDLETIVKKDAAAPASSIEIQLFLDLLAQLGMDESVVVSSVRKQAQEILSGLKSSPPARVQAKTLYLLVGQIYELLGDPGFNIA